MLKYAGNSPAPAFIVGTEQGLLHSLKKACPDKSFYPAAPHMVCPNMKSTTLEKVRWALEDMTPQIEVEPRVRERARQALARMLEIGGDR
jgi:quinolinate synthase